MLETLLLGRFRIFNSKTFDPGGGGGRGRGEERGMAAKGAR
jgi:hypothetical protein